MITMAGVSLVTLCSRSGSASSAANAVSARTTSMFRTRGTDRTAVLPAAARFCDELTLLSLSAVHWAHIRREHYFRGSKPDRLKGSDGRRYRGPRASKLAERSPAGGDQ
jgi:hypothetical protein